MSYWAYGIAAVVGGTTAIVSAPAIVAGLGFGAGGIAVGSIAAAAMSTLGPTAAGGVVATLQSVGAAGLGSAGSTVVASAGGVIAAAATKVLGG